MGNFSLDRCKRGTTHCQCWWILMVLHTARNTNSQTRHRDAGGCTMRPPCITVIAVPDVFYPTSGSIGSGRSRQRGGLLIKKERSRRDATRKTRTFSIAYAVRTTQTINPLYEMILEMPGPWRFAVLGNGRQLGSRPRPGHLRLDRKQPACLPCDLESGMDALSRQWLSASSVAIEE